MATTADTPPKRHQATERLAAFWRWWTSELGQLVPEALSPQGRVARLPLVSIDGDVAALLATPAGASGQPAQVDLANLDTARARAAIRGLLERAGETRGRARLALPHNDVLLRRVTLPLATEENLPQVLAFEMDRLTPFRAEDVYHDERIMSRDTAAGTLSAILAVARRETVDARLERLRALGVSVQGISVQEEPAHPGAPLDLLPAERRGEAEAPAERVLRRVLIGAVALLLVAVLFVPIWQKRETAIALNPVVAKARQDAEATDRIARELDRQVSDYNFLLAKKHGAYPTLAYLEEVSRLLPDHTWVQELQIKNTGKTRELQIQGETNSSAKLLETLAQSQLLQDVNSRGTVTRGSVPGTERFMMTAVTKPRPQPEAIALADMPTPVGGPPAQPPNAAPASQPPHPAPASQPPQAAPAPQKGPAPPPPASSEPQLRPGGGMIRRYDPR